MSPRAAVLGLSALGHDPAACLIVNGKLVAAVEEERLNRQKRTSAFPHQSIEFVLRQAKLSLSEVDVAYYWDDRGQLPRALASSIRRFALRPASSASQMFRQLKSWHGPAALREALLQHVDGQVGALPRIHFVPHHRAHLAAAIFSSESPIDAALVIDGRGEHAATSAFGGARDGRLPRLIEEVAFPNSLGVFFGAITQVLGYEAISDEYKVMGLASYGGPNPGARAKVGALLDVRVDGSYLLNDALIDASRCSSAALPWLSSAGRELFAGDYHDASGGFTQEAKDLAFEAQAALERAVAGLIRRLRDRTGARAIALAGGVIMNAVAVGRLRAANLVDSLHVPLAPTDAGACVGAALAVLASHGRALPAPAELTNPFQGPGYSESELEAVLRQARWPYRRSATPSTDAARSIQSGNILGWFDDRMEFGERALGARSILADPRRPDTRDRINASVKRRESYRPFAPSILEEDAARYFETRCSRRMAEVVRATDLARRDVPSAVHIDGTARPQTVPADWPVASFRRLIEEFKGLTGVPMVINTSFNVRSEPIVCTPEDAVRCFAASGLDELYLGPFVISKGVTS